METGKSIIVICCIIGLIGFFACTVNAAPPTCGTDHYWFEITGTCEPCSTLCDPPAVYVHECPERCPDYRPKPRPSEGSHHRLNQWLIILIAVCTIVFSGLIFCLNLRYGWVNSVFGMIQNRINRTCPKNEDTLKVPIQEVGSDSGEFNQGDADLGGTRSF